MEICSAQMTTPPPHLPSPRIPYAVGQARATRHAHPPGQPETASAPRGSPEVPAFIPQRFPRAPVVEGDSEIRDSREEYPPARRMNDDVMNAIRGSVTKLLASDHSTVGGPHSTPRTSSR